MNKNKNISINVNELDKLTKSSTLDLEKLSLQYDQLIKDYNQVSTDYSNFLMTNVENPDNSTQLSILKGHSFWGTGVAGKQHVNTNAASADDCKALCSQNSLCSGATFNAVSYGKPYCWLRTGKGDIIKASNDDYAIIPQRLIYLNKMKAINSKMREINRTILSIMETRGDKIYSSQKHLTRQKGKMLNDNYNLLLTEKENIENTIKDYESLEEEYNNGSISVKQNYMWFILLFIIALLIVILIVRVSLISSNSVIQLGGGDLKMKTMYYIIGALMISVVLFLYKNN
jgi:hypothetical protein